MPNCIYLVKRLLENDVKMPLIGIFTSLDLFVRDDEEKEKLLSELGDKNEVIHIVDDKKFLIIRKPSRRTDK